MTMTNDAFTTLNVSDMQRDLSGLLRRITAQTGRVEIRSDDGASDCVLISKQELESLERALEVLSNTDGVRAISNSIAQWGHIESAAAVQTPPA